MTAAVLSAGDGYKYYTESVATGDVQRAKGTELTDYYTVDGNPPGVWMGGGAALLGLSGEVTEAQMRALFGEGLHPDADAITAGMAAAGVSEKDIAAAIKLGRAYAKYDVKDATLRKRIDAQVVEFERLHGRKPDRDERRQIRMREGAIVFRNSHGRAPLDKEELGKFVTSALKPAQHAVAGFDLTFSAPKTVSLLWALADRKTANLIEQAHEAAIQDTIAYLQEHAVATRAGVNGVRQIDVKGGIIATRFRHHESRTGDVHLHDHLVVANKVQGADGKWRTLDSKLLLRMKVAGSEHYDMRLFDRLEELGIRGRERVLVRGKLPRLEVAGISDALIGAHSSRGQSIKKATDELVKQYTREHGRTPDRAALIKLSAQAWQQTRPAKDAPRSIAQLRRDVRTKSLRHASYHEVDVLEQHVRKQSKLAAAADKLKPPIDVHDAARQVMGNVEAVRGTWGEHHVRAEITRWVSAHRYRRFTITDGGQTRTITRQEAQRFLLRTTLQLDSIRVTPEHVHGRFQPLTRADGESVYVSKGRTLYTSTRILEAELRLLTAARTTTPTPSRVSAAAFARALAGQPNKDTAQVRLACEFATNPAQLLVGIGPAGAGKTRSMRLAAAAAREGGVRMIGLAPSKQAARVFRDDVGVPAHTLDAFLLAHHSANRDGRTVTGKYRVQPGDVVVVDEAAMASTQQLDQATRIITSLGGRVRLLGDHAQIGAVGAGGAVRLLTQEVGAVELENVYRFTDPAERAASKILRESAPEVDPFAWYKANGRIVAATRDWITEVLFGDYLTDLAAGRDAIMGAPTREYVDELNARAQAHAIATGKVTGRRAAPLSDGHSAHVGDQVMTRLNQRTLTMNQGRDEVTNGDLYTVTNVHRDGSLTVRHTKHSGTVRLPAAYVKAHTHLGYAYTAQQEQGDTIGGKNAHGQFVEGVAGGIVNAATPRAIAYVLATRAVTKNVLYVEVEPGQHPDDVLATIAGNVDRNLTAHEMIDVETDRILDLARLVDEHADVVELANQVRFETLAHRVLGDRAAAILTGSDGWDAVAAGLARTERYGLNVDQVLTETWTQRDFKNAEDIGAVMSWRIEGHLEHLLETGTVEPLPEPGTDTGVYEWAVDRHTVRHPDLPPAWREHLTERAAYIDQRMTLRGTELALEQPEWTRQLGPVPADPDRHRKWMRLAAEIDLFRTRYRVPADEPAAIPERLQQQDVGRNLAARATALHKSVAISHARGNTTTADPTRQAEAIAVQLAKVEQHRPIADAETALTALNPDRTDRLSRQLETTAAAATRDASPESASEEAMKNAARRLQRIAERARLREQLAAQETEHHPTHDDPSPTVRERGPRLR